MQLARMFFLTKSTAIERVIMAIAALASTSSSGKAPKPGS
jgi:hypothetical protein